MAKEKLVVLKEANIKNNCPECFHNELTVTFYQKQKFGKFIHKTTSEVSNDIKCQRCHSTIYPVNWTDDIERSFNYYQKLAVPHKTSVKFTSLFYIVILILIAVVAAAVYVFTQKIIEF